MLDRLAGREVYDDFDRDLRQKYWQQIEKFTNEHPNSFWYNAEPGREFLRNNLWLTK